MLNILRSYTAFPMIYLIAWKNENWTLAANLHDKKEYVIHMINLKQALNHGLVLKKVLTVVKFNQKSWLNPYIDMNTDLTQKTRNDFEKYFLKLMNNAVFVETVGNVRNHRDIKLVITEVRRDYLVSEPNYHTAKSFSENILALEMKLMKFVMNQLVYLGLSILELIKIVWVLDWLRETKILRKNIKVIWILIVLWSM